ncbi:regulator of sigma E protease [Solimonas aquatica]|uniref:Zinc metalloprotease n=1 Tax=Solimonas aquatica TaxID=489703 RepID=A0A1H9AJN4_9GAMM|nr:RIP metalloprotease RseP [Solimonas aquatica]SEP76974.1 regulator of sigma E protease [Solimonas aquatica]
MPEIFWSLGGFLVAIGVLVSFHEFGHYYVARRCGVRVLRFSIGFGRQLWTYRAKDGVEWSLSLIPLGGYVKMLDEREGIVPPALRDQAFNNASVGKRMAIVAAGPIFNFALAVVLYWTVFVIGVQGLRPVLAEPPAGSLAAKAGLVAGEEITRVAGEPVDTWDDLRARIVDRALDKNSLPLTVKRGNGSLESLSLPLSGVRVDPEYLFRDLGLRPYEKPIPAVIERLEPGEAAEASGVKPGDQLLSYNGVPISSWQQWAGWVRAHPGELAKLEVRRQNQIVQLQVIIGQLGHGEETMGRFGAAVANPGDLWQDLRAVSRSGPLEALPKALDETWRMSSLTLRMLWRMVTGEVSVKNVSGPIQIAQVAGYSAQIGLVAFLSFMAVVSVSLGVLNLLPVPVLDGGHLLYYGVEAVKGSPLSERAQEAGQRLGFTLLALLMGLAFYNDVVRLLN